MTDNGGALREMTVFLAWHLMTRNMAWLLVTLLALYSDGRIPIYNVNENNDSGGRRWWTKCSLPFL